MQLSAEIRWFWNDRTPEGLNDWFLSDAVHGCVAGGGGTREDRYLVDRKQLELGIKQRGGSHRVEVKSMVAEHRATLSEGPFAGEVQIWVKLSSGVLQITPTVTTTKQRRLRAFDTTGPAPVEIPLNQDEKPEDGRKLPVSGCNVEITKVSLTTGQVWWTLGFESYGELDSITNGLIATATELAKRKPPQLTGGSHYSYPAWLAQL